MGGTASDVDGTVVVASGIAAVATVRGVIAVIVVAAAADRDAVWPRRFKQLLLLYLPGQQDRS